jgi:predicted TIM-barrel fold metal-dependent hydrolase
MTQSDANPSPSGRYLGYDISSELLNLGDSRLAAMDAAGIDLQVVSLTMPGCEAFDGETAIAMATDANDRLAQAIQAHPTRLAGFASLPTANSTTAAKELERAVTKLGFKGALINGHVRGEFLDNRKYWAIFECAQALNVPIYLHPTVPHPDVLKAYFEGYVDLATPAWGFAMDTCTHFLRLVFSGLFDACPNLKMILGHLGEGLPFWIHRLNDHQTARLEKGSRAVPSKSPIVLLFGQITRNRPARSNTSIRVAGYAGVRRCGRSGSFGTTLQFRVLRKPSKGHP